MARAALSICAAASALRSGSMSLEFSGQITRSGWGCRPAATSAASCSVTRTWLSSTARRWALKSRPRRGTLPWTAAIVTVGSGFPGVGGTSAASGPETIASTAVSAGTTSARGLRLTTSLRTSSPRASPASTVANDSSGSPPIAASGSSGPSGWPKPTRPHGSPPNGTRPRSASAPIHTAAAHSGPTRSRDTSAMHAPPRPTNSASNTHSATHGTGPTSEPIHTSSGSRNARPNTKPQPNPARTPRPRSTPQSSANAGSASHQQGARREAQVQQQATARRTEETGGERGPRPALAAGGPRRGCRFRRRVERSGFARWVRPPREPTSPDVGSRCRPAARERAPGQAGTGARRWALPRASSGPGAPLRRYHS